MEFEGKVAIVTGSTSGFGQTIALMFAKKGASVTLHGLEVEEQIQQTLEAFKDANIPDTKILTIWGKLEDESIQNRLINETIQRFGKLDILVNNAGVGTTGYQDSNSLKSFDEIININLRCPYALTILAAPHLAKTKGNILNMGSIFSLIGSGNFMPYDVSKGGLANLTRTAALRYAKDEIRVNAVLPSFGATNIASRAGITAETIGHVVSSYVDNFCPMGRLVELNEIANAVEFLCSTKASFITGVLLNVDGGTLAGQKYKSASR